MTPYQNSSLDDKKIDAPVLLNGGFVLTVEDRNDGMARLVIVAVTIAHPARAYPQPWESKEAASARAQGFGTGLLLMAGLAKGGSVLIEGVSSAD